MKSNLQTSLDKEFLWCLEYKINDFAWEYIHTALAKLSVSTWKNEKVWNDSALHDFFNGFEVLLSCWYDKPQGYYVISKKNKRVYHMRSNTYSVAYIKSYFMKSDITYYEILGILTTHAGHHVAHNYLTNMYLECQENSLFPKLYKEILKEMIGIINNPALLSWHIYDFVILKANYGVFVPSKKL